MEVRLMKGSRTEKALPIVQAKDPVFGHATVDNLKQTDWNNRNQVTTIRKRNMDKDKSIDFGGFIRARPYLRHVRTRHRAPETNGVVERFFGSLKYEHLYRLEIEDVLRLVAEVEAYRLIYNTVRPHEALDFERPLERYLRAPLEAHLFPAGSVQES